MNQPYGYIYTTYDHFHNLIYVGQKKGLVEQTTKYLGSGVRIKSIINKRKHHLEKRILGYCETKEELNEAEKLCIEFFDARNSIYGYNYAIGGEGGGMIGKKHSKETKQKIKIASIGIKNSMYGKQQSEESNLKRSQKQLGKKKKPHGPMSFIQKQIRSKANLGKMPWNKNKQLSENHKANLRKSWLNRKTKAQEIS